MKSLALVVNLLWLPLSSPRWRRPLSFAESTTTAFVARHCRTSRVATANGNGNLVFVAKRRTESTAEMQPHQQEASSDQGPLRFIDIGANLLDDRFINGIYHGSKRHEGDILAVLTRAADAGVSHIVLTAGTIQESKEAVQYVRKWRRGCFQYRADKGSDIAAAGLITKEPVALQDRIHFACTVGVHPTRTKQVFVDSRASDSDEEHDNKLLQELLDIALDGMKDGAVVAIGEIGLDYDRLSFSPADIQQEYLVKQLQTLAPATQLPLFLHNRNAQQDLYDILKSHQSLWDHDSSRPGGVVHSFDDTLELAKLFIDDLGLCIGLNGCSLRTEESLNVVKQLPLSSILLETDCPYCDIRSTHASFPHIQTSYANQSKPEKKFQEGFLVKSRTEPCHVRQIAEVVAGIKQVPLVEVARACYDSTLRLYRWDTNDGNEDSNANYPTTKRN
jgi:TatD DNase family protein